MDLEKTNIKTPFLVPENYFRDLEDCIWSEVNLSKTLMGKNQHVEKDYFDTLENHILSVTQLDKTIKQTKEKDTYFDELENQILSQISLGQFSQPKVSETYFDELENEILAQVKIDSIPQLSVPANYFEDLESKIISQVTIGNLKQENVSESYFEDLESTILAKTVAKPKFTLTKNLKFFRNAAALVILAGASYIGIDLQKTNTTDLSQISTDEMIAYLSEQTIMEEDLEFIVQDPNIYTIMDIPENDISDYLIENGI